MEHKKSFFLTGFRQVDTAVKETTYILIISAWIKEFAKIAPKKGGGGGRRGGGGNG